MSFRIGPILEEIAIVVLWLLNSPAFKYSMNCIFNRICLVCKSENDKSTNDILL